MNIICVVSKNPSHLDFGGNGYLKLARSFTDRGHNLTWFAPEEHCKFLKIENFNVDLRHEVNILTNPVPFSSIDDITADKEKYLRRLDALRSLFSLLKKQNPDVIFLDRALPFVSLIAEELELPYVSVGSPGGYWCQLENGKSLSSKSDDLYAEIAQEITRDLGWSKGSLSSIWVNSPYFNISFLGKSFYDGDNYHFPHASFIHHFPKRAHTGNKNKAGISFGASGSVNRMINVLHWVDKYSRHFNRFDVFTGNNASKVKDITFENTSKFEIHNWVNFSDYFPYLSLLIFFGGIGTIWLCLHYEIPMLVVAGGAGDQEFNGKNICRLGLGELLTHTEVNPFNLATTFDKLENSAIYLETIRKFKDYSNFTDTMDTIADKIERL